MTIPWTLTGTPNQQAIVRDAFERIKFPFERLTLPGSPELGWRDLNGSDDWWLAKGRKHEGQQHAPAREDRPEPLNGEIDGRKWIMGVFFPVSARVYLDLALEDYPDTAKAVVSAEIAHAVDEFLPLTDAQRAEFIRLVHPEGSDHIDTWWEKADYGAEYYNLIGETFMILFTKAYSDIPFGDTSPFVHRGDNITAEQVRAVIGIERTDAVRFVVYGKSKIYHKPTHYDRPGITPVSLVGYRPCKVCKP
jgi:hypothetical protein